MVTRAYIYTAITRPKDTLHGGVVRELVRLLKQAGLKQSADDTTS